MEVYCGSTFWNSSLTWNTDSPDFTLCFKETVLVWVPCLFLWTFSLFDVYHMKKSAFKDIPWNFLNISKLLCSFVIINLALFDLFTALHHKESEEVVYDVDLYTPVLRLLTWVVFAIFVGCNRKYGICVSGVQFLFCLLSVVCGTPQLISFDLHSTNLKTFNKFAVFMVYYVIQVIVLFLNCCADKPPKQSKYKKLPNALSANERSYLSRLFILWFDSFVIKSFKKSLKNNDLLNVDYEDYPDLLFSKFQKHWKKAFQKKDRNLYEYGRVDLESDPNRVQYEPVSIIPSLCKTLSSALFFICVLRLMADLLSFASPLMLELLLTHIQSEDPSWRAILHVVTLFVSGVLHSLTTSQYFYQLGLCGIRARTITVSAIYRKAFRISNSVKKQFSLGKILNLMQADALILDDLVHYVIMVWSLPLRITISICYLWRLIGISVFAGVLVMIFFLPIYFTTITKLESLRRTQEKFKISRVAIVKEAINNMKIIKLYGLEAFFKEKIMNVRIQEILILKKAAYVRSFMIMLLSLAPSLITLVAFTFFLHTNENKDFTPQRAFVSLMLFLNMQHWMSNVPTVLAYIAEARVSIRRINKFLNSKELNPNNVKHDTTFDDPVVIEQGRFSWGGDLILKDINLRCKKGQVTVVVGLAGSGKSSLISAVLGEMNKISGLVNTIGSIAYVGPHHWVEKASIRQNIVFGKRFDEERYKQVIEACFLKECIEKLPVRDESEISEHDSNLSKGEKQRINLARAVYSNADLYLMNDPLNYLDADTEKHLFQAVLGPDGLLKNTTRLISTRSLKYLPIADKIIVLKDGEVCESGTLVELIEKKGAFLEHLLTFDENTENKEMQEFLDYSKRLEFKKLFEDTEEIEFETTKLSVDEGNVKSSVFKFYIQMIGVAIAFSLIFAHSLNHVFGVSLNAWLSVWSSRANATISQHNVFISVYAGLGIAHAMLIFVGVASLCVICLHASHLLHILLLEKILKAPITTFFEVTPTGRILNRFTRDVNACDIDIPVGISRCLTTLVVVSYTTPLFLIVVAPMGSIYVLIERLYSNTSRQLKRLQLYVRWQLYSYVCETIDGATIYRAYGETERCIAQFDYQSDLPSYAFIFAKSWLAVRLYIMGNLITFFAALFAIINHQVNAALLGLSMSYAMQVTQCLSEFVITTANLETDIVSIERLKEYTEILEEDTWNTPDTNVSNFWPQTGVIKFNHYSCRYLPGLDLVLKDINITIAHKEKIGIVGSRSSGKTSLTLALFKIVEAAEGEVLIDNVNISQINVRTLRSRLTAVPQKTVLFSGTIRSNIDPYEEYTDDDIWWALEQVFMKDYVKDQVLGLYSKIVDENNFLSLEQKQLLCFSRAFLKKSNVLIIDEATSGLDLETESLVFKRLKAVFKESTVIAVAHGLNVIMDFDRVIVLDGGSIAECDSPDTLIRDQDSMFYRFKKVFDQNTEQCLMFEDSLNLPP